MSGTIAEYNNFNPADRQNAIVQTINRDNQFLMRIPFETIMGNRKEWWVETEEDASVGARAINGNFQEGSGQVNKQNAVLKYYGGHLDLDKKLVESDTEGLTANKLDHKLRSLGIKLTHDMIRGNTSVNPNEVNGIYRILGEGNDYYSSVGNVELLDSTYTAAQLDACVGRGVNDAAVGLQINSTANRLLLLEAIDKGIARMPVKPDIMLMGSQTKLLLKRSFYDAGGSIGRIVKDQFGNDVLAYDDIPIVLAPKYANGLDIMAFDEDSPDASTGTATNTDCASILLIKFGEGEYYSGVRGANLSVSERRLRDDGVTYRWTIEQDVTHYLARYDSIYRIGGIRR